MVCPCSRNGASQRTVRRSFGEFCRSPPAVDGGPAPEASPLAARAVITPTELAEERRGALELRTGIGARSAVRVGN